MSIYITKPNLISSFQFLVANRPTTAVVSDIFSGDLDGDGVKELVFVGRQTQPATISTWTNSTVHIFKANESTWTEVTSSWLPDNVIIGTEPSLEFGDFNRDGRMDLFIPSDTDMDYLVPSYLFVNTGKTFIKQAVDFQTWAHGSYVSDVNKDGYLDVLNTDYGPRTGIGFGSATGFNYKPTEYRGPSKASSICAADFLGDGSITILISDDMGVNSTVLYKWSLNNQSVLSLEKISTLPTPRFELSKWDSFNFEGTYGNRSHDIRIVPFDFSGDGLMDAIEISRPWLTNGSWPEHSEIQFLLNTGNGIFKDVTDSKLVGYNTSSSASYQPQFIDANGDGKFDIFISGSDFSKYNSATLLLQQVDGTFLDYGREKFSSLWNEAVAEVKKIIPSWVYSEWGQTMHLVLDPENNIQVIGSVAFQNSEGMSNYVFSSTLRFYEVTSGNDQIYGTIRNDILNGEGGIDTVTVSNSISNYSVTKTARGYTLFDKLGSDGTDSILNIEAIKFTDKTINLIVQAKAASAPQADVTRLLELYTAFFNRVPDADGMSFWIDEMKSGQSINQVAESFYNAGVNYSSLTGFSSTMKNADFINVIYKNVLGRKDGADAGGLSFWETEITSGRATRGTLVTNILDSAHTFKGDKTWGWVADLLDNKITVAKKFSIDMGLNYNTPEESITKGMAIASAITSTDTSAAVTLIGVTEANLHLG